MKTYLKLKWFFCEDFSIDCLYKMCQMVNFIIRASWRWNKPHKKEGRMCLKCWNLRLLQRFNRTRYHSLKELWANLKQFCWYYQENKNRPPWKTIFTSTIHSCNLIRPDMKMCVCAKWRNKREKSRIRQ